MGFIMQMNNFSERLKSERQRLNLSQEELGEACGVKKLAQFNYEKGERTPDANYLIKAAELGLDIQYILTGVAVSNHTKQSVATMLQGSTDTGLYDAIIQDMHSRAEIVKKREQLYADLFDMMNTFDDERMERIRLNIRDAYLANVHDNKK